MLELVSEIKEILGHYNVFLNEPMNKHTSFKTGGSADVFVTPESFVEVKALIEFLNQNKTPYFIMGNGTNLLVRDKGIRGVVIQLGEKLKGISLSEKNIIYAQTGASLSALAAFAAEESLSGLEFASGIPGTVGGGISMNAGAYGGELKDVLNFALVLDGSEFKKLTPKELEMCYRHSNIESKGRIVLGGEFKLKERASSEIKEEMRRFNSERREKQPLDFPSAGSTFKRPEGNFAGKLISDCGLKGVSVGGAMVSQKHAGFIINKGGAKASDILELIDLCINKVFNETGIKLETEIKIIGEE